MGHKVDKTEEQLPQFNKLGTGAFFRLLGRNEKPYGAVMMKILGNHVDDRGNSLNAVVVITREVEVMGALRHINLEALVEEYGDVRSKVIQEIEVELNP